MKYLNLVLCSKNDNYCGNPIANLWIPDEISSQMNYIFNDEKWGLIDV
jgi:hypothetical protein